MKPASASDDYKGPDLTLDDLLKSGFDSAVTFNIKGTVWHLDAKALLERVARRGICKRYGRECSHWLSGPLVSEWIVGGPIANEQGKPHPHLAVYFAVRAYGPAAVWQGLRLIRRYRVRAIWSTYPIMTAHCIARTLSGMAKLPWIADFRDPVTSSVSAENPFSVASQKRWERRVLLSATRAVLTTPGALRTYAERYPEAHRQGRLTIIGNGYDETAFADLPRPRSRQSGRPLVLLHSGLLYPEGRNPVPFFTALARLKEAGGMKADNLRIVLRASGSEATYTREIQRLGLEGMVNLAPPISNRQALAEQAKAGALLLFQGSQYDRQIPAKLYEYLRIGRPIFALVGEKGDTAAVLQDTGGAELVSLDDVTAIETRLIEFIHALREGRGPRARPAAVARHSRRDGAKLLAGLLDGAISVVPA